MWGHMWAWRDGNRGGLGRGIEWGRGGRPGLGCGCFGVFVRVPVGGVELT